MGCKELETLERRCGFKVPKRPQTKVATFKKKGLQAFGDLLEPSSGFVYVGICFLASGGPFSMTQCCENEDLEPRFTLLPVSPKRIGMCMKVLFGHVWTGFATQSIALTMPSKAPSDHVSIAAAIAEDFPDGSAAWISAGDVERMLRATEGRSTSQAGLTTKTLMLLLPIRGLISWEMSFVCSI